MESTLRRTWAEIDLDALAHNYQTLRRRTETRFVGVVKADAYGHGSVQVSRVLEELGADYLAVSSLDEAKELRRAGIQAPILILGHTPPSGRAAASEPTSWLSAQLHILFHLTVLWDLSCGSGCFPFHHETYLT